MYEIKTSMEYKVNLTALDESQARAEARAHSLTLNIKKGDGSAGFNAAETLMAALGTCLLTNVNAIAAKMHLKVENAQVEIEAQRSDEPPLMTEIRYRLILDSAEPFEKLQELHELALKWGTVTNTLIEGIVPQGELVVHPSGRDA